MIARIRDRGMFWVNAVALALFASSLVFVAIAGGSWSDVVIVSAATTTALFGLLLSMERTR